MDRWQRRQWRWWSDDRNSQSVGSRYSVKFNCGWNFSKQKSNRKRGGTRSRRTVVADHYRSVCCYLCKVIYVKLSRRSSKWGNCFVLSLSRLLEYIISSHWSEIKGVLHFQIMLMRSKFCMYPSSRDCKTPFLPDVHV